MRFLVIILAAAVMAFSGCDLELGGGGDQYKVTFDVTDGKQGVVFKKGENSYGNIAVFLYSTDTTPGTLIASKSGISLNADGTADVDSGETDPSDYFYLKVNGGVFDASGSKVRYQGVDYDGLAAAGTVTFETHVTGDTTITATSFTITLNDGVGGSDIVINGTFSVFGIDLDASDPVK